MVVRVVGKKGQVTIPKEIRERFGLKEGEKVVFEVRGDEIVIKPEKACSEKKGRDYVKELTSIVRKKIEAPEPSKLKELYYEQVEEHLSGL